MNNTLTPYQEWQLHTKGNILPEAKKTKDEDLEESGLEELDRLAEWIESLAELELIEHE